MSVEEDHVRANFAHLLVQLYAAAKGAEPGLSLGTLQRDSGVAKQTISNWLRADSMPQDPERLFQFLEAVRTAAPGLSVSLTDKELWQQRYYEVKQVESRPRSERRKAGEAQRYLESRPEGLSAETAARNQIITHIRQLHLAPVSKELKTVPQTEIPVRLLRGQVTPADDFQPSGGTQEAQMWSGTPQVPLEFFDDSGRRLLILGERGCGKSVFLNRLLQGLLDRAVTDPAQPIPISLDLATWHVDTDLYGWMTISARRLGFSTFRFHQWLREGRVLPLIDNLDRPQGGDVDAAVLALNAMLDQYPELPGIAVVSTAGAYRAGRHRAMLNTAVLLEPIAAHTIAALLQQPEHSALQGLVAGDHRLAVLLRHRLSLTLLWEIGALEVAEIDQLAVTQHNARQAIVAIYVEKLRRRARLRPATVRGQRRQSWEDAQVERWLHHVARYMDQCGIRALHPLWLQPEFIDPTGGPRARVCRSFVVLGAAMMASLLLLLIAVPVGLFLSEVPSGWEYNALPNDLMLILFLVVVAGFGFAFGYDRTISPIIQIGWTWPLRRRQLAVTAAIAAATGLIAALITWNLDQPGEALPVGTIFAVGMTGTYITYRGAAVEQDATAVPSLEWSPRRLMRHGLMYGALVGAAGGALVGIWVGIVGSPLAGLVNVFHYGGGAAVMMAAANALRAGGRVWLQHALLCLVAALSGYAPLRFTALLEVLASREVLTFERGNYRFQHELVAEHFARTAAPGGTALASVPPS